VNVKLFLFSPFSRVSSIAWDFLSNLGIFRNKILGFLKIQSGTTAWVFLDHHNYQIDKSPRRVRLTLCQCEWPHLGLYHFDLMNAKVRLWLTDGHRRRQLYSRGSTCCPIICAGPAPNVKCCPITGIGLNIGPKYLNHHKLMKYKWYILLSQRLTDDAAQSVWNTCTHCTAFHVSIRQRLSGPIPLPPGRKPWLQKPRF